MSIKTHFNNQKKYFNKEFSQVSVYTLAAWQKSYVKKIKGYVLERDYKRKTLLDIGTGQGYIAVEMAKLGMHVIACDLSDKAIENLYKYKKQYNLKSIDLLVSNAEEIPLKENSVDYIVCNALLEHLPNEQKAITNWKKILKKNGKVFITVPLSLRYVWPFLWPVTMLYDRRLGHLRRYDAGSLKRKFQLPVEHIFYTGHLAKVFGVIFSSLFGIHKFDQLLETIDEFSQKRAYGANNISIVFKKS